jgi:hypothetical protein
LALLFSLALLAGFAGLTASRNADAAPSDEGSGGARGEIVTWTDGSQVRVQELASPSLLPAELAASRPMMVVQGSQQSEVIAEMDFEDATFPPTDWEVDDQVTVTFGPDAVDAWSRQICQTDLNRGGTAAAWSAGGGTSGAALACGQNPGKALGTRLFRDGIDTRAYPFGITVDFSVWLDLPLTGDSSRAMKTCWRESNADTAQCSSIVIDNSQLLKRWLVLTAPVTFATAANKASIELMFWFDDRTGTGAYAGAFIDNVRIEGLTSAPPPTPTPATPATQRPTTVVNTPTPSITPTPTERAKIAYLPILMRSADKDDPEMMPEPPTKGLIVEFGTALDAGDRVQGKGTRFQYGHMRLCSQISWFGQPPATRISWQWFQKSGSQFQKIGSATLNDYIVVGQEERRYISKCIAAVDGEGRDVPIWMNEYKVEAYIDDPESSGPADAMQIAIVQQDPPPGATRIPIGPTPQPTGAASPTPKATGGPPLEAGCTQYAVNGDFERGPSVGWTLRTNVAAPNDTTARVIQRAADLGLVAADGGDWLAIMGRALNVRDQLLTESFPLPQASQIISASLDFSFGMVTTETRDGNHDDTFLAAMLNQDGQNQTIPNSGISEELVDPNNWYSLNNPLDITQLVTARAGWTSAQVLFQSLNDDKAASAHLLDAVSLVICTRSADPNPLMPLSSASHVRIDAELGDFMPASQLRPSGPILDRMGRDQADGLMRELDLRRH